MNKFIKISLVLGLAFSELNAFAKDDSAHKKILKEAAELIDLSNNHIALCATDGELKTGTYATDKANLKKTIGGMAVDCDKAAIQISKRLDAFQEKRKKVPALNPDANKNCVDCKVKTEQFNSLLASAEKLAEEAEKIDGGIIRAKELDNSCTKEGKSKEIVSKDCAKGALCSMGRSVKAVIPDQWEKSFDQAMGGGSCISSSKPSCGGNVLQGAIRSVMMNVEGIWELAKLAAGGIAALPGAAYSGAKSLASWSYKKLFGVEDATSDKALASTKVSPASLAQFTKDAGKWIADQTKAFFNWIMEASMDTFACQKWIADGSNSMTDSACAAVPMAKGCKCGAPLKNFSCVSCDDAMGITCGIVGILGAEVPFAFMTGGAVKATQVMHKSLSKSSNIYKRGASFVANKVQGGAVKATKVGEWTAAKVATTMKGAKTLKDKSAVLMKELDDLTAKMAEASGNATVKKIDKWVKETAGDAATKSKAAANVTVKGLKTAGESTVKGVVKGAKATYDTPILGSYLKSMDDAFVAGMNIGNKGKVGVAAGKAGALDEVIGSSGDEIADSMKAALGDDVVSVSQAKNSGQAIGKSPSDSIATHLDEAVEDADQLIIASTEKEVQQAKLKLEVDNLADGSKVVNKTDDITKQPYKEVSPQGPACPPGTKINVGFDTKTATLGNITQSLIK